ncbi:MAG: hypothetical protein DRI73_03220 [Bacteroidetes bacterium]|nr:MAG: hypothetical protein DRI73_03220 [Bacteroidota bacterium]
MDLKEIVAISGKPGLYKFISQGKNAIIVENIETKTRTSAFASEKVSKLEDIAIFTEDEESPLKDVFKKIFDREEGKETISHKSKPQELKDWFKEVLPEYDEERVYVSDIKKIALWYNTLARMEMLVFEEEKEEKEEKRSEDAAENEKEETKEAATTKEEKAGDKK